MRRSIAHPGGDHRPARNRGRPCSWGSRKRNARRTDRRHQAELNEPRRIRGMHRYGDTAVADRTAGSALARSGGPELEPPGRWLVAQAGPRSHGASDSESGAFATRAPSVAERTGLCRAIPARGEQATTRVSGRPARSGIAAVHFAHRPTADGAAQQSLAAERAAGGTRWQEGARGRARVLA